MKIILICQLAGREYHTGFFKKPWFIVYCLEENHCKYKDTNTLKINQNKAGPSIFIPEKINFRSMNKQ